MEILDDEVSQLSVGDNKISEIYGDYDSELSETEFEDYTFVDDKNEFQS